MLLFFLKIFFWWKICNVSVMLFLLLYVHGCVTRTCWKTRPRPKTVILPIMKSNQLTHSLTSSFPVFLFTSTSVKVNNYCQVNLNDKESLPLVSVSRYVHLLCKFRMTFTWTRNAAKRSNDREFSGYHQKWVTIGSPVTTLPGIWGQYHGDWWPSTDDSFHSPTITPPSALDKLSIMMRYHRRWTTRCGVTARSPTMVTLHDNRFVECRWWIDGWTVKTVVPWRSSAFMILAPGAQGSVLGLVGLVLVNCCWVR